MGIEECDICDAPSAADKYQKEIGKLKKKVEELEEKIKALEGKVQSEREEAYCEGVKDGAADGY